MNLTAIRAAFDQSFYKVVVSRACLCSILFIPFAGTTRTNAQMPSDASPADLLAHASLSVGPAPTKDSTPFLITRVVPKGSDADTCYLEAVTQGMKYDLFADGVAACRHLPDYHAIQWGHRGGRLNQDAIELVYSKPGEAVKTATYFIRRSVAIQPDWTEDQ